MTEFSLRNLRLIFAREFRVHVYTRSFVIATFATPLLLGLFLLLPLFLDAIAGPRAERPRVRRVVIVCGDPIVRHFLTEQLAEDPPAAHQIEIDPDTSISQRRRLNAELRVSAIAAYVWLGRDPVARGQGDYYTRGSGNYSLYAYLRNNITLALARARLRMRGVSQLDTDLALRSVDLRFNSAGAEPLPADALAGYAGYILAYLLLFTLMSYGTMVTQSVIEEKMSRIAEILLLSTSPEELIAGKILGVGSVGLAQITIWLVLAAALAMLSPDIRHTFASMHIGAGILIPFVSFYLLGYLLYSALFAIAGVLRGESRTGSQWTMVAVMPLLVAVMLLPMVFPAPDSTAAALTSMIPYFAPVLMPARMAAVPLPGWQIALCIALMAAAIVMSWMACARIYRVGILMYGKRSSLREIARWVRYK